MTATLSGSSAPTSANVLMTVTVHNGGATPIDVNSISVPLPAGFSFFNILTVDFGTPTIAPTPSDTGTLVWSGFSLPTLAAGASASIDFHVTTSSVPGGYSFTPTGTTTAGSVTSNAVSVELGAPTLGLGITASSPSITPGGAAVNVITTYANTGTVSATDATMVMTVPAGFTVTSPGGGTWSAGPRTITWTLGTIAGLASASRTVSVTTHSPYSGASPASFPVQITADGPLTASASSALMVDTPGSALGVDITLADPNVAAGATVPLTIHYANASPHAAAGAQLTIAIPSGFTFASASNSGSHSSGTVTWSLGSLAGSATGSVTVNVVASSPWTGLLNPATFLAPLSATSATSATDTQLVGVDYGNGTTVCSTYYFQSTAFTNGTAATTGYLATAAEPTASTPTTISLSVTTTPQFVGRFFQGPAATTDVVFNGTLTTYFYVSKSSGPQLKLDASVYDFNPGDDSKTPLGQASFTKTGSGTNVEYSFAIPLTGTLPKGHRLLWEFDAYSNNNTNFTFNFGSVNGAVAASNSPSRASFCVDPPATPVLDHDVTPLLGSTSGYTTYVFDASSDGQAPGGPIVAGGSGVLVVLASIDSPYGGSSTDILSTAGLVSAQTTSLTDKPLVKLLAPAVSVEVTSNATIAVPGDTITYTAAVTNYGAAPASLTLTSTLPVQAYYTYVANSPAEGGSAVASENFTTPMLTIPLASLAAGASTTVTWQMDVASGSVPAGTTPHTLSVVVADSGAVNVTSNSVTVNTDTVPALDVQITASAPHTPAEAGDIVTVTATVASTGGATATGVTFAGPIFASGAYVGGSLSLTGTGALTDVVDGDAGRFNGGANAVSVALGNLAPGDVRVLSWQVRLSADLTAGANTITGTGTAVAGNAGSRSDTYDVATTAAVVMTATLQAVARLPR